MPFYYLIFIFTVLSLLIFLIRSFVQSKKNIPVELFVAALLQENSGHFEKAVIGYESALHEVKKIRFNRVLKNKIIEKLKLLHTVIEYNNNFILIREPR
jgi:hypothetical protein